MEIENMGIMGLMTHASAAMANIARRTNAEDLAALLKIDPAVCEQMLRVGHRLGELLDGRGEE